MQWSVDGSEVRASRCGVRVELARTGELNLRGGGLECASVCTLPGSGSGRQWHRRLWLRFLSFPTAQSHPCGLRAGNGQAAAVAVPDQKRFDLRLSTLVRRWRSLPTSMPRVRDLMSISRPSFRTLDSRAALWCVCRACSLARRALASYLCICGSPLRTRTVRRRVRAFASSIFTRLRWVAGVLPSRVLLVTYPLTVAQPVDCVNQRYWALRHHRLGSGACVPANP